ncbi:MAG: peptidoglycan binding domain-containing protein [Ruminococcus sp.]|nr:peptidoglycan binding domain-containing protein [Ruminococcus sp.]
MAVSGTKKRKKKKKVNLPLMITLGVVSALIIGLLVVYFIGRARYSGRFLPNTYINGINVSGMTLDETVQKFAHPEELSGFTVMKQDGTEVKIDLADIGYKYDTREKIEEIFSRQDSAAWFMGYAGKADYSFTDKSSYEPERLAAAIDAADWGNTPTQDAQIVMNDDGMYEVKEAVQGDDMDKGKLKEYLLAKFASGVYYVKAADSGCYIAPKVVGAELDQKCERLNMLSGLAVMYDFNYTTEILRGEKLLDMVHFDEDTFEITADRDKVMKYIDELAEKYDTYGKPRKFHATLQGDIIVETSDDAVYGWWIDKEKTCDQLVEILEKCEDAGVIEPIYYNLYGFEYTGVPEARTKDDDIGDTYCEIDLTAQHFWYYVKGELKYDSNIVSGTGTSKVRMTLPGVYKVWSKATNYRMKGTNANGESWDSTCNYWNNVSICGIGMHDTTWRYAFGGNIYLYNGSHGCINMPYNTAKYVYDNVPLGTPVVMYYKSADAE